jgi:hypothetical protein
MKGMKKLKKAGKKATRKLPKPIQKKADRKLGLFIHKYIATLYYFDDEINDIYFDMEEQGEKGYWHPSDIPEDSEERSVEELSNEMNRVIMMRSDENSAYYSRRHDKMSDKISKKMSEQAEKIEDLSGKNPMALYKKVKDLMSSSDIDEEEIEEAFEEVDLEDE